MSVQKVPGYSSDTTASHSTQTGAKEEGSKVSQFFLANLPKDVLAHIFFSIGDNRFLSNTTSVSKEFALVCSKVKELHQVSKWIQANQAVLHVEENKISDGAHWNLILAPSCQEQFAQHLPWGISTGYKLLCKLLPDERAKQAEEGVQKSVIELSNFNQCQKIGEITEPLPSRICDLADQKQVALLLDLIHSIEDPQVAFQLARKIALRLLLNKDLVSAFKIHNQWNPNVKTIIDEERMRDEGHFFLTKQDIPKQSVIDSGLLLSVFPRSLTGIEAFQECISGSALDMQTFLYLLYVWVSQLTITGPESGNDGVFLMLALVDSLDHCQFTNKTWPEKKIMLKQSALFLAAKYYTIQCEGCEKSLAALLKILDKNELDKHSLDRSVDRACSVSQLTIWLLSDLSPTHYPKVSGLYPVLKESLQALHLLDESKVEKFLGMYLSASIHMINTAVCEYLSESQDPEKLKTIINGLLEEVFWCNKGCKVEVKLYQTADPFSILFATLRKPEHRIVLETLYLSCPMLLTLWEIQEPGKTAYKGKISVQVRKINK